jgi:hypothetical protein
MNWAAFGAGGRCFKIQGEAMTNMPDEIVGPLVFAAAAALFLAGYVFGREHKP